MIAEYPFTSRFHTVGDYKLHYIDEGEGPVVICVHGNPTWSYYYRNLVKKLSSTHRVIALDHLGCGLSDKPADYDYCLANHIRNLSSLIEYLDIPRYSLVVHDWGGAIGMGCAVSDPACVEKIVVLNSAAFRSRRIPFRIGICKIPFIGPFIVRALNGFAWPATFMAVSKPLSPDVKRGYLMPYDSWQNRIAVSSFVQDIPLKPDHPSYQTLAEVEEGLKEVAQREIPIFVGWGGRDFCFNRHFYDEWLRRFPDALHHYFPEGGHYVLEDEFDRLAPLIVGFLSGEKGK